ncbi:hypothetical protein [Amycolatopsis sp. CA-230715]|uniref:hypothetical protein n=1 Tax=Amycolatopsis sp. CA-230715 TaxID=2745196 RepID=UPI001C012CA6|nr:hypothetical protein [Amycolatopsis sp. CA-230715]QWF77803.1 hypothetical protein HUW46_01196 [Amycolatopsis sp. CA-230715]
MLKKAGFVVTAAAAAALAGGGAAMAAPADHPAPGHHGHHGGQVGLINLNNIDVLHNVNVSPGVCGNDVNVLGVQVPIRNALNGIGLPILSPGENENETATPYNCAASAVVDGGTSQHN